MAKRARPSIPSSLGCLVTSLSVVVRALHRVEEMVTKFLLPLTDWDLTFPQMGMRQPSWSLIRGKPLFPESG
jgi:hypothetical protein